MRWAIRVGLVVLSVALALAVAALVDRAVGALWVPPEQPRGLALPPGVTANYAGKEFSYTVRANSFGFRDYEVQFEHPGAYRIVVLGDSFTYGFGVDLEHGWVKRLESALRVDPGGSVEALNLGHPGGYPRHYLGILRQAIPTLKPDLALLAVLAGDDLAQYAGRLEREAADRQQRADLLAWCLSRCVNAPRSVVYRLLPNTLALAHPAASYSDQTQDIRANWVTQAREMVGALEGEQLRRYRSLDDQIRADFEAGDLNPGLMILGLRRPDYLTRLADLESPTVQAAVDALASDLAEMKQLADQHGVRLAVLALPYRAYMSEPEQKALNRVGVMTAPDMLTSDTQDEAIRRAALRAGLPFEQVTGAFRQASRQAPLSFPLDGHWNADGNRLFAELVRPLVARLIGSGP